MEHIRQHAKEYNVCHPSGCNTKAIPTLYRETAKEIAQVTNIIDSITVDVNINDPCARLRCRLTRRWPKQGLKSSRRGLIARNVLPIVLGHLVCRLTSLNEPPSFSKRDVHRGAPRRGSNWTKRRHLREGRSATTGADSGFELLERERDRMDARLEPLTPRGRSDAQAAEVPRACASSSDMFGKAKSRS